MPLQDHFRPPLSGVRHWEGFHSAWANELVRTLNRGLLPARCFAEAQIHFGSRVEIDVATFDKDSSSAHPNGDAGAVAVQTWAPPVASLTMPAVFPDEVEIQVLDTSAGPTLVAAIELVSPRNKDRPASRRAFIAKCAAYLQMGIGLIVVDIVTGRQANLHDELIGFLDEPDQFRYSQPTMLYGVAYCPRRLETSDHIEFWPVSLAVGQSLPTLPLALRNIATILVDLETTYTSTCKDLRL